MFVHLISQGAPLQMVSTKCLVVSAVCRRYYTLCTHIGHCSGTNLSGLHQKGDILPNTRAIFREHPDVWLMQHAMTGERHPSEAKCTVIHDLLLLYHVEMKMHRWKISNQSPAVAICVAATCSPFKVGVQQAGARRTLLPEFLS